MTLLFLGVREHPLSRIFNFVPRSFCFLPINTEPQAQNVVLNSDMQSLERDTSQRWIIPYNLTPLLLLFLSNWTAWGYFERHCYLFMSCRKTVLFLPTLQMPQHTASSIVPYGNPIPLPPRQNPLSTPTCPFHISFLPPKVMPRSPPRHGKCGVIVWDKEDPILWVESLIVQMWLFIWGVVDWVGGWLVGSAAWRMRANFYGNYAFLYHLLFSEISPSVGSCFQPHPWRRGRERGQDQTVKKESDIQCNSCILINSNQKSLCFSVNRTRK